MQPKSLLVFVTLFLHVYALPQNLNSDLQRRVVTAPAKAPAAKPPVAAPPVKVPPPVAAPAKPPVAAPAKPPVVAPAKPPVAAPAKPPVAAPANPPVAAPAKPPVAAPAPPTKPPANPPATPNTGTPAVPVTPPVGPVTNTGPQCTAKGCSTCQKKQKRARGLKHQFDAREQFNFFLKSDQPGNKEQGTIVDRVTTSLGATSNIFKPTFGNWPGSTQPAIIKCLKNSAGYIAERDNTKRADSLNVYPVDQFIDSGEQLDESCRPTGTKCFVLRDLTKSNPPLIDLDDLAKKKGRGAACDAVYDTALPVAQAKVRELGGKGFIHGDLDTTNMFFNAELTSVEFIDWADLKPGNAEDADLFANTLGVIFAAQKDTNC